jgi:short-subunit dehydrogenase
LAQGERVKRVAVFGATSAIAQALARLYAAEGASFFLVGRNADRLDAVAADLRVRGAASVATSVADLSDTRSHAVLVAQAVETPIDVAVVAHGTLPDQEACTRDADLALAEIHGNFVGHASLLTHLANALEAQGRGSLAVIGSVAGDRGRRTNYVYGSAKAGLAAFTEGLRHRLGPRGVNVLLVKPGLVDSPMTAHMPKQGVLWSTPERVARDVRTGIERGRAVVYAPWYWRGIMYVIRSMPDALFRRLSI